MDPRWKERDFDQRFHCHVAIVACWHVNGLVQKKKEKWHKTFHGNAVEDMANLVLCLGWEEKGYPMDIHRSGKPKLRIALYSKEEMNKWEASLDRGY